MEQYSRPQPPSRWILLYSVLLLAVIPIAQPVWNVYFVNSIGKVISIEWIHVIQYGLLSLIGSWGYLVRFNIRRFIRLYCLIVSIALLDEFLQGLLPNRFFQWSDVILDGAGGILGIAIYLCINKLRIFFKSAN